MDTDAGSSFFFEVVLEVLGVVGDLPPNKEVSLEVLFEELFFLVFGLEEGHLEGVEVDV